MLRNMLLLDIVLWSFTQVATTMVPVSPHWHWHAGLSVMDISGSWHRNGSTAYSSSSQVYRPRHVCELIADERIRVPKSLDATGGLLLLSKRQT
jgi:hypothetical protein